MYKVMNFILLVVLLSVITCSNRNTKYNISGIADGFENDTFLYLDNFFDQTIIDSTKIINGKFTFSGNIDEPINYMLRTKDYSDLVVFWIENSNIKIKFTKGNSKYSKVIGSKIQNRVNEFEKEIESLNRSILNYKSCKFTNKDSITSSRLQKEKDSIQTKINNKHIDYIINNPNDIYSSFLLTCLIQKLDKEKINKLYNLLNFEVQESNYGRYIQKYIKYSRDYNIGDKIKNFGMRNPQEKIIYLNNYKGNNLLISFWMAGGNKTTGFVNCKGCYFTNKLLGSLYEKYHKKGLNILSISLDGNKTDWLKGIKRDNLIWENVCDFKSFQGIIPITFKVNAIPKLILVDSNMKIIETNAVKIEETLKNIYDK